MDKEEKEGRDKKNSRNQEEQNNESEIDSEDEKESFFHTPKNYMSNINSKRNHETLATGTATEIIPKRKDSSPLISSQSLDNLREEVHKLREEEARQKKT